MDNNWALNSLTISLQKYGEFQGKYVGKIEFQNKTNEAFMFNLSPEKTAKYIQLVSEELVSSASALGQDLMVSLNLLPDAFTKSPTFQIQAKDLPF